MVTFTFSISDRGRLGGRCCKLSPSKTFSKPSSLFFFLVISPLFSLAPSQNCLFSLSFHPHTPSFFHPTSPLFPPSQGQALHGLVRLVSLAHLEHTNTHLGANIHSGTYLFILTEGPSLNASEWSRKKTENDKQTGGRKKREEADKEGVNCAFLWLAWLGSTGDVLLAVRFIIPKPYGLASFWGVVEYICVCVCV